MSTAWSYSSLTSFETCPRRYKLVRIKKAVVEPQTEATTHGNEVHKALEVSVRDNTALADKYARYANLVDAVKAAPGEKQAELKFGLTNALTPTGFFSPDVWVRGVFDLVIQREKSVTVIDWKTGKPKNDGDQLKLFAAASFAMFPQVQTVRTGYAWLAYNKLDQEKFERAQAPEIWKEFRGRVARIDLAHHSDNYPPRPSGLCKAWCPVPASMCEFSGKR